MWWGLIGTPTLNSWTFNILQMELRKLKQKRPFFSQTFQTYQLGKDLVASSQLRDDAITYSIIIERMQKPERYALVPRYEFDNKARNSSVSVSHYVELWSKLGEAMQMERNSRMITESLKFKTRQPFFWSCSSKVLATEWANKDV